MATKTATKSAIRTAPASITITYDLFDLPTAQHKAGVAGLVMQIQSMKERRKPADEIPEIVGEVGATSVTIRFTEKSIQGLMDDLYDAETGFAEVESKWKDATIIEEKYVEKLDRRTGETKRVKVYVYEVVQPCGHFLKQYLPDDDGRWLKLWRDMLWAIPRAKPTTRGPYNARAEKPKRPCPEGPATWKDLLAYEKARRKGTFKTDAISSALLLGAQAVNAEAVSFEGRVEQTLLLHCWPLTVLLFVPQVIDNDGASEFVGYSLAIPEVSDLESFCADFPALLERLPKDPRGYRPAGAVIDLPEQSALEFLEHLAQLAEHAVRRGKLADSVNSIEYLHLVKVGNNVKSQAAGRIAPNPDLMRSYFDVARRGEYRNPIFRAGLLRSLLESLREPTPWYASFCDMLQTRPWPLFVHCDQTPSKLPWFAADAATRFEHAATEYKESVEAFRPPSPKENFDMTEETDARNDEAPKPPLEMLVYRLVQTYVNRKCEEKSGITWEEIKKRPLVKDEKSGRERLDVPANYREAREKIVSDVFLAMRSRREQDFVNYFTATICSVGQFLPAADFQIVAQALLRSHEEVKTVTLLALSANS